MSFLLTSLFLAAASATQTTAPPAAAQADVIVEGERPKSKIQCRSIKISGSRMPRKVCKTGDNSAHLLPGVSDSVSTRGRVAGGIEGEPETPGSQ
jgi:hypothetical protein